MHSSVQWDTMQTRRRSACYTSASGECPVTRWRGKHENILSEKFSTIENRGLDKLLSRPACLIALFRKRINQLQTFACFGLRINLRPTQIRGNSLELSFVFLGLWLPKFTQIPASVKRHLLGVLDTTRQCWDVLVNPAEHLWDV